MSTVDKRLLEFADRTIDRYFEANPAHNFCEMKAGGQVFRRFRGGDTVVMNSVDRNKRRNVRRAARRA